MAAVSGPLHARIILIGGGIAGLWLLNRLRREGHDAVLLEKSALGAGQTLASQGIIHGGLKYALNGALSPASSAIADMPRRWRRCLAGEGEVDLRQCRLLSPHYYMWSGSTYRSRLKTFLGSKALRGRIDTVKPRDYPEFFRQSAAGGTLYRLADFVVDTSSLLETLAGADRDRIYRATDIRLQTGPEQRIRTITARGRDREWRLKADRYILCAGEGNEELLTQTGTVSPSMQRRPLHMVAVRHSHPHPAYMHCIGDSFGTAPRLTVTTHPAGDNERFWYLGGELAEKGVERSEPGQQAVARSELQSLFPRVNLDGAQWSSFLVNRAEPRTGNLQRPDAAWVQAFQNMLVVWPTKLALCPDLGDRVMEQLSGDSPAPAGEGLPDPRFRDAFDFPGIAGPRWEELS